MVKSTRLAVTTVFGALFGVVCMLLSKYTVGIDFWPIGVSLLLSHIVLGVAIGASSLAMNWAGHGILWGAMFGAFINIGLIGRVATPQNGVMFLFVVIWGFLIETIATKGFRQAQ